MIKSTATHPTLRLHHDAFHKVVSRDNDEIEEEGDQSAEQDGKSQVPHRANSQCQWRPIVIEANHF